MWAKVPPKRNNHKEAPLQYVHWRNVTSEKKKQFAGSLFGKKMYAYQHYNNHRTVLHIKLWPAIRKLNLFSVINDPNWIVSTDLACIGTNDRKYVLVSKKKIVYSDESIRIFPTLRPRDERVTLPVVPHLKVIASKWNPRHKQQRDTYLCIRTALEIGEHIDFGFQSNPKRSARPRPRRNAKRTGCLPINEHTTTWREKNNHIPTTTTSHTIWRKNNFAAKRNPICQTYKLKPQTIVLQKYKQSGGRLSAFYTYSHKQLFITVIIDLWLHHNIIEYWNHR